MDNLEIKNQFFLSLSERDRRHYAALESFRGCLKFHENKNRLCNFGLPNLKITFLYIQQI